MKLLSAQQIRELDEYTIAHHYEHSYQLMEVAASAVAGWLEAMLEEYQDERIAIFCGPGNNGGDGLALARILQQRFFEVDVSICQIGDSVSPDFQYNLERLEELGTVDIYDLYEGDDLPEVAAPILIDAIFGTGLNRPVTGYWAEVLHHLSADEGIKISIDIPSGLYADQPVEGAAFRADTTLTFGFPKISFFFKESEPYLGSWFMLDIGLDKGFQEQVETKYHLLEHADIFPLMKRRSKVTHKGHYGHSLIIAGSHGKIGAAILCAKACYRSGAGLVTIHTPGCGYQILQMSVPEAMVSVDRHQFHFSDLPDLGKYQALAIGPGIGQDPVTEEAFLKLLQEVECPLILDADALNLLSKQDNWLESLPKGSVLTPHVKEFERLFGKMSSTLEAFERQMEMSQKYGIYIVRKDYITSISDPDGQLHICRKGNPGMATGGSGDVLTGIITGLAGQYLYDTGDAVLIGTMAHGIAGDLVYIERESFEALLSSDLIDKLGMAFRYLHTHPDDMASEITNKMDDWMGGIFNDFDEEDKGDYFGGQLN